MNIQAPSRQTALIQEILELKKKKNAVLLAHYYQEPAIQEIADFVGDSLGLSQEAALTKADMIVFAGVHFMAETAKILNPGRRVLLPDTAAGCSLADSCPPEQFAEFIARYPQHTVVTYVNCSAAIKAMSDLVCTSSNAVDIINSIPASKGIIFAPDKNLGSYLIKKTGRKNMILWDGACVVHEAFAIDKLLALHRAHPRACIVAHPESEAHILEAAHFIGSTSEMISFVKKSANSEFIVATEAGILHKMSEAAPGKLLIPAPAIEENSCACSECAYMKLNTLEKIRNCLLFERPEITIDETLRIKALAPVKRMFELSAKKQHEQTA